MIVASRGPGASACGLAGAPGKGRDAAAPAQLIASYALRAAGTSPGLYDFLQPRNEEWSRGRGPELPHPRVTLLSPQSPGSLFLDIGQATSAQDACASSFLDESLGI